MRKGLSNTMATVNLTINGQKTTAPAGSTVLQAAQKAQIDIPTLCDHPALAPIGACRMCLVEIKGQRILQPACTFPVSEGMEVQTESAPVVKARKFVLDLLFSERNHYCMYCEMSGDCELQALGYRYGLDHWAYPTYIKRFPVDATRKYFLMDHNRCILCRRCVRACSDIVANHTLGLKQRGASTMIDADMNVPFGESTCISCGTCLQVCPTGALVDKRSAFTGRNVQTEHVKSVCSQCSVGCGMEVVTRGENVLRIEGDWDSPVSAGLLCQKGRFDPLYDERKRIAQPLIRKGGKLKPASWDEALQAVAKRIGATEGRKLGVVSTSSATNEALYLLSALFVQALGTTNVGLLNAATTKLADESAGSLADVTKSDMILVVGADPVQDQPVASMLVKRAIDKGARLVIVDGKDNGLAPFAHKAFGMADADQAAELASRAEHPVVLYGTGIADSVVKALKPLAGKATFVELEPGSNTRAAVAFGLANGFKPSGAQVVYLLVGEQDGDGAAMLKKLGKEAFIVAQASYTSAWTERADVVLPMAIWSERSGSLTSTDGRVQAAKQAVTAYGEAKPDWEILALLATKLGRKLGTSLEEVSTRANQDLR